MFREIKNFTCEQMNRLLYLCGFEHVAVKYKNDNAWVVINDNKQLHATSEHILITLLTNLTIEEVEENIETILTV